MELGDWLRSLGLEKLLRHEPAEALPSPLEARMGLAAV
jgi:hypothetical protein